jgi:hypothetical protein
MKQIDNTTGIASNSKTFVLDLIIIFDVFNKSQRIIRWYRAFNI